LKLIKLEDIDQETPLKKPFSFQVNGRIGPEKNSRRRAQRGEGRKARPEKVMLE